MRVALHGSAPGGVFSVFRKCKGRYIAVRRALKARSGAFRRFGAFCNREEEPVLPPDPMPGALFPDEPKFWRIRLREWLTALPGTRHFPLHTLLAVHGETGSQDTLPEHL